MDNPASSRKDHVPAKAYLNLGFLKSRDARAVRILSEYLEPASRLRWHQVEDTIVFFGSARTVALDESTRYLARLRAEAETGLTKPPEAEIARAEHQVKLSRYYEDARELAR